MKMKMTILCFTVLSYTLHGQDTIVLWDFENQTTQPAEGEGVIELIGGVEEASTPFPQGSGGNGTYAYNSTAYPSQGTNSGTGGFQFTLSTSGHENIKTGFAVKGSNTASKWAEFQFSVDGGVTWITLQNNEGLFNNGWQGTYELDLPEEADNAETFLFRIVTIFAPDTQEYEAIGSGSNYSTIGTLRIDDVIFYSEDTASGENFSTDAIKFYPNPAEDIIYFKTPKKTVFNVTIYNALGNEVLSEKLVSEKLNISKLKSGVYIMKWIMDGNTTIHKLIVR